MRRGATAFACLLVAFALCSCTERERAAEELTAEILQYSQGDDPAELVLTIASGPADTKGNAEVVSQDNEAIVVKATVKRPTAPVEDVRIFIEVPVVLEQPLDGRQVFDVDGKEIARK